MTSTHPAFTTSEGGMSRLRLKLAYDGSPFSGWATQPGLRTVQGTLEEALELIVRRPVRLTVAGRTDAGVHARGQVAHCDLSAQEISMLEDKASSSMEAGALPQLRRKLSGALNRVLGEASGAIVVQQVERAPKGFDARFSALNRRYSYLIADRTDLRDPLQRHSVWWAKSPLSIERMNEAAAPLIGLNDFEAFCKPREGATTVRELQSLTFLRRPNGLIEATIQADAFCHNMVRYLIGSASLVGEAKYPTPWMHQRLLARERDSRSLLAPAHPLVFEEVTYPDDSELNARAEQTRALRRPTELPTR